MNNDGAERFRRAAEDLTDATVQSYKAVVDRAFAARESNERLTRHFFEEGVDFFHQGVELNRRTLEELAEGARRQREALAEISRSSLDAYDGFLDSLYDYAGETEQNGHGT